MKAKLAKFGVISLMLLHLTQILYPSFGTVTRVDKKSNTLYIRDMYGYTRKFDRNGCEDIFKGDNVALLVYNNYTEHNLKDDQILKIRYVG